MTFKPKIIVFVFYIGHQRCKCKVGHLEKLEKLDIEVEYGNITSGTGGTLGYGDFYLLRHLRPPSLRQRPEYPKGWFGKDLGQVR